MKYVPYEKQYNLTTNDRDIFSNITPTAILNILQDISSLDASRLGCGYKDLKTKDIIWILARAEYRILNVLKDYTSPIKVVTYPNPSNGFFVDRNYKILDGNGTILLVAKFKWAFISYTNRDLIPFNKVIEKDEYEYPTTKEINEELKALDINEKNLLNAYEFEVKFSMCDENKHMNNTKYFQELLNACELKKNEFISAMKCNYLKELPLHSKVTIKYLKTKDKIESIFYLNNQIATKIILFLKEKHPA